MVRSKQISFLEKVRAHVREGQSMVNELAELLNISNDSAYRRLRGDTDLSFEEALLISNKYQVSLDSEVYDHQKSGTVQFNYESITSKESFIKYLSSIHKELTLIKEQGGSILYQATVLPFFYTLGTEYFTIFKYFTWSRYIHNIDAFQIEKIESSEDYLYIKDLLSKIYRLYQQINSVEVWAEDTFESTILQLKYYKELGLFETKAEVEKIVEELKELIMMLHKQTVEKQKASGATYSLYLSELSMDNTCIVTKYHNKQRVYLRHMFMNTINTENPMFCSELTSDIENTIQKSLLLSGASEKQRSQFFKRMSLRVEELLD